MKNYRRWAALTSAAVLTLSYPIQVLADEVNQNGTTMETAVTVPALSEDSVPENTVSGENAGGGTVVQGINPGGTGVTDVQGINPGGTGVTDVQGINPGGTGVTDVQGTNPGTAGVTDVQGVNPSGTGGTGVTGVPSEAQDTAAQPSEAVKEKEDTPVDYSRGPGYFNQKQEEEPVQEEIPVEEPVQEPVKEEEPLPVPNPVQTLPSQLLRGVIAQDGSIMLNGVENSIVQVADKYTYDQMILDMSLLKVRYGDKIHIRSMGESLDGRTLYDCIIGNPKAPKHILIQGGIHAREYLNPLLMMQQMELALANYDTGSFHGMPLYAMFDHVAVHFVPMTNPDGISISQFGPAAIRSEQLQAEINQCYAMDIARGKASMDANYYYSHWKANARGVDLNLNFDALWAEIGGGSPSSSGFRGLTPASEPETQAMINLYQNPEYSWAAAIHYHSMGNVIYWDIRGNKVQAESLQFAQLMSSVTGGYRILPSTGGGGFKDWIQLSERPVPSVTLETGKVSCPIPAAYYGEIWNQNCLTWAYAMEWVAAR